MSQILATGGFKVGHEMISKYTKLSKIIKHKNPKKSGNFSKLWTTEVIDCKNLGHDIKEVENHCFSVSLVARGDALPKEIYTVYM